MFLVKVLSHCKCHVAYIYVDGSECTFLCNDGACGGFSVHCEDLRLCTFGSGFSTSNFEEIDCESNSGQYVVTASGDNVLCPDLTYDYSLAEPPALQPQDVVVGSADSVLSAQANDVYGPEDGECYLANECPEAVFESGQTAYCQGYQACQRAQFRPGSYPVCYGVESCTESTFSTNLRCQGKSSCKSGEYTSDADFTMICRGQVLYLRHY